MIYLDTAATAQKPQCVIDTISEFYSSAYGTVHRGIYALSREATKGYALVREKVKSFLGAASSEEIIFTRGTTASLNLVARTFPLAPNETILVSEIEHHSNFIPWQMVAQEKGATLKIIPVNESGEIDLDAYADLLKQGVKIVSLAHISNVIGTLHPIKKLAAMAHAAGSVFCLDAAQSVGHLPLDVQDLDVDFLACSGHKMYGPTGIGILYGKRHLLEAMPPLEGGGDMIERVTLEKTTYAPLPLKFEAGTPMIAEVMGLGAALDYIQGIGLERIEGLERDLTEYAFAVLGQVPGLRWIGGSRARGPILSFILEGIHPFDLGTFLDCRGIAIRTGHHCSQMAMERFGVSATARISFGLYNTRDDVDQCVNAIKEISAMF